MEDMKSYTVRVETGEIRLMSQEEVSKLVRTTMARADSGVPATKKTTSFSRNRSTYTAASDLSRRLSLSPRPLTTAASSRLHFGVHPEERAKSPTSKLFQGFRSAIATSTGTVPTPSGDAGDNNSNNTHLVDLVDERTYMKESLQTTDERFSALVRTVGPTIDPDNDPHDVSFTVSTEADGSKNLSEQELHALVRSSIIRARFNSRHKKFRRKPSTEPATDNSATVSVRSDSSSPTKRLSRKFSWSTVEKSDDDEEMEDFRDDDEIFDRDAYNETNAGWMDVRQESEIAEQPSIDNHQHAVDEMVNAEKNNISAHGSDEELFITPCTSAKNDALDGSISKQAEDGADSSIIRPADAEAQLLSLVLSAGGDTSISDQDICNMVKHSMAKARLTRQEITDLLEDTPSGVTKMDLGTTFDCTTRQSKDSARTFGVKSLSPRRRKPVGHILPRIETATVIEIPSGIVHDNVPIDNNTAIPTTMEITTDQDTMTSTEVVADQKKSDELLMMVVEAQCDPSTPSDEANATPLLDVIHDSTTPEVSPNVEDGYKNVPSIQDAESCVDEDIEEALDDLNVDVDDKQENVESVAILQQVGNSDEEILPPTVAPEECIQQDIEKAHSHAEQSNSCCFQMCCMPIILSSSSVEEREESYKRSTLTIAATGIEQQQEEIISGVVPSPELDIQAFDCVESKLEQEELRSIIAYVESKLEKEELSSTIAPLQNLGSIIDLTDIDPSVATASIDQEKDVDPSMAAASTEQEKETDPNMTIASTDQKTDKPIENYENEDVAMELSNNVDETKNEQDIVVEKVQPVPIEGTDLQNIGIDVVKRITSCEVEAIYVEVKPEPELDLMSKNSPCMTCFHVPMNPVTSPVNDDFDQKVEVYETLKQETHDNNAIVPGSNNAIILETRQTDVAQIHTTDKVSCNEEQKSKLKLDRQAKISKYNRLKEYYEVKTVITNEFLNEVISRKGSKISVSELAKILKGDASRNSEKITKLIQDDESALHNNSADETMLSDRTDIKEKNDSSLEPNSLCMDFLSICFDFDLREVDDDFGSASLFPDDSRDAAWAESIVDAESKCEIANIGTNRYIDPYDDRPSRGTGYESEFATSLDENERRRLTFSFSDGRYTGSLSSDEY